MTAAARPGRYAPNRDQASGRHSALADAAARIRVRRGLSVPVEQILLIVGSILFPLGIVLIFLGWYGAAHTGRLYAQIDYLISGGLLGVAVTAAGGFMYFGYWLSRQLRESRRQSALALEAIERLEKAVGAKAPAPVSPGSGHLEAPSPTAATQNRSGRGGRDGRGGRTPLRAPRSNGAEPRRSDLDRRGRATGSGRDALRGPAPHAEDTPAGGLPLLVATPHGSLLHRPDCPIVARRDGLKAVPPGTDGYGYCTMCDAAAVLT